MARDVAFAVSPPDTRWSAATLPGRWTPRPPNTRWAVTIVATTNLSTASLQYVRARVTASTAAGPINPTGDTVAMALLPVGVTPGSGDWQTASWDPGGVNSGAYLAQCLVGPGGAITLIAGTYQVWVKVTDNPEVPVLPAGTIVVS